MKRKIFSLIFALLSLVLLSTMPSYAAWILFTRHAIDVSYGAACSVYATDVDGDGDIDVLGAADSADDIAWWDNDGSQKFTKHVIDGSFDGACSVYATDVDGDGDIDVLGAAAYADAIAWWENVGSQNFNKHVIDGSFSGAHSVYATDVDGDGDIDVLGAAAYADDIAWWENAGSQNFNKHVIDGSFGAACSVYATDVDGDGDIDVLGAAQWDDGIACDDIAWWENVGADTTPPTDPTAVHSTSHFVDTWSNDNTIDVAWTAATDAGSGLDGYSILWNTTATTIPDQTKDIEEVVAATSPALADGGNHYFHIRSVDNAGNWQSTAVHLGPFCIDTTAPSDPTDVHSTSHTVGIWSNDNTIDVAWTAATDAVSGLDGYSILWNTNDTTIPDAIKDIEEVVAATSPALADGSSHWFHIRSVDNAGNWQSTKHLGPFFIDTTAPSDPTDVHSTSHTVGTWSNNNTIDVTWTDATDAGSGLDGYSILWDTSATTIPDAVKDIEDNVLAATSAALADGNNHYFHIRSVDNLGNWQSTFHLGPFFIDTTAPSDPTDVHSTSHTVSTWSNDNTIDVTWTDATDAGSSLGGYSILWDTSATTIPDAVKDIEQGVQATTSAALADGNSHYFHIRSVDNLGNWQSTVHLGPFFIDTTPPAKRPARPASFLISYPGIVPAKVQPNKPVSVLVDVKNIGSSRGRYDAVLYINDEVEDTQTAYISPGQTQRLVFTVYREAPGKYWASVGGYGAWFTVAEAAEVAEYEVETSPPPPSGGLGTPALLAIILGSVGVGVAIFFATRPRRI